VQQYKILQGELRLKLLDLYHKAKAGHIGSSLSCLDLLIYLFCIEKKKEEILLLSKGHAAGALYVVLNHLGELSDAQLATYYHDGTIIPAHPANSLYSGIAEIPFSTGSLGHGLSIGCGIAMADKMVGRNSRVFCVMSDGECNEGAVWEAAMFGAHHRLGNLYAFIDKNDIQGFGRTQTVLENAVTREKWQSFGFDVFSCDGHDLDDIARTMAGIQKSNRKRPKCIICKTIKGCGVSYMEDRMEWHYLPMSDELYLRAQKDVLNKYLCENFFVKH